MATFAAYHRISNEEIQASVKSLILRSEDFFAANPKRRVARVGVWYGQEAKIRRKHIAENCQKAADEAKV